MDKRRSSIARALFDKPVRKMRRVTSPGLLRVQLQDELGVPGWIDGVTCGEPDRMGRTFCKGKNSCTGTTVLFAKTSIDLFHVEESSWPWPKLAGAGVAGLFLGFLLHKVGSRA